MAHIWYDTSFVTVCNICHVTCLFDIKMLQNPYLWNILFNLGSSQYFEIFLKLFLNQTETILKKKSDICVNHKYVINCWYNTGIHNKNNWFLIHNWIIFGMTQIYKKDIIYVIFIPYRDVSEPILDKYLVRFELLTIFLKIF